MYVRAVLIHYRRVAPEDGLKVFVVYFAGNTDRMFLRSYFFRKKMLKGRSFTSSGRRL
jgi:hypothetical protein